VAYGFYGQDVPGAAARFPLLRCTAPAASEPAQAKRAYGDSELRVSLHGSAVVASARPVLCGGCYHQGRSPALGLLCETIRQHAPPMLTPCSRSQW
jgi:hypothetical protein